MIQALSTQGTGHQPLPDTFVLPDLVPVRMLAEFAYCPRLAYLMWVQSEWDDSSDTVEGRLRHQRVDRETGDLPDLELLPEAQFEPIHGTSVSVSAPSAGLIAKIDLIEGNGGIVSPVDYKRGKIPDTTEQSYEPERIQVCAQAIILRENGYHVENGIIYYVGSKKRVEIPITEELVQATFSYLQNMKEVALIQKIPPPLVDSPKCPRCSLVGICLPDETNQLAEIETKPVRRLVPSRDDVMPLAVQKQGAYVGKKGEVIQVKYEGQVLSESRLIDISQVMLFGGVQISTQCVQEIMNSGIPLLYFSYGGWFQGYTTGLGHKNIERRISQFRAADQPEIALRIAKQLVRDKAANCRTLLRRNIPECPEEPLRKIKREIEKIDSSDSLDSLLGHEGTVARIYFENFGKMLKAESKGINGFDFSARNRRPPKDPVNTLLSFTYSMLVKDLTVALVSVGFDPFLGFYHQPRYGRPALALDMMEPFRPLIADSVVLWCINNGVVDEQDFIRVAGACTMSSECRKRLILAYERRMDSLITHPVFDYRISYRRILEVQCRLLARFLENESKNPPSFVTR